MIITLKGADFSNNNIGVINVLGVSFALGKGAIVSSDTPMSATRNQRYIAKIIIKDAYMLSDTNAISVKMGGVEYKDEVVTIEDKLITINIPVATSNIAIVVNTIRNPEYILPKLATPVIEIVEE